MVFGSPSETTSKERANSDAERKSSDGLKTSDGSGSSRRKTDKKPASKHKVSAGRIRLTGSSDMSGGESGMFGFVPLLFVSGLSAGDWILGRGYSLKSRLQRMTLQQDGSPLF